jgi:glucose/arabinose dehydrogenase
MKRLALCLAVALAGAAGPARADLAPALVGKVSLDMQYVTGATLPTDIAFSGDGRAVITLKGGTVLVRRADGTVASVPYFFPGTLDTASEKGLLGVVADPSVATNRAFYFYVSNGPTEDKHRVHRAVLSAAGETFTVDATPIIGAARGLGPGLEGPANHDGGGLSIAGGKLFVGVGDTGSNASPPTNKYGSCLNKGNGKILRVNLDGTIPSDNPLVALSSVTACNTTTGAWTTAAPDKRIFAWGQRNPFRVWADPVTDRVWVGDVGEVTREEIGIYAGGEHGGYPFVEGDTTWGTVDGQTCSSMTPSRACFAPALAYAPTVGRAVTGGLIPDGCGWSKALGGTRYVFGDYTGDWIRAAPVSAARTGLTSTTTSDVATGNGPVALRLGPDGAIYVVLNAAGAVHRLVPLDRTGPDCSSAVPARSGWSTAALVALLLGLGAWSARARATRRGAGPRTPTPAA